MLTVSSFSDLLNSLLGNMDLATNFLNQVTFLQTSTDTTALTQTEQENSALVEVKTIVQALSNYYCGNSSGG